MQVNVLFSHCGEGFQCALSFTPVHELWQGGKAICHRKQRKRAGSYFSRMAVIGCAILPRRGKGSSFSSFPSVPLLEQKVVLFANGHCKGLSKDQNRSCNLKFLLGCT